MKMNKTLIVTTKDLRDESGDTDLFLPSGTRMMVLSDEVEHVIAETMDGEISTPIPPDSFKYKALEVGDVVNIYEDPRSCLNFEGKAKLISKLKSDWGDGWSVWDVKFLSDGYQVMRSVNHETAFKVV